MTDGAAATLLMSREKADALGIKPLARFVNFQVAGCKPDEMGVGPRYAIPKLLDKVGLECDDCHELEPGEPLEEVTAEMCEDCHEED